MARDGENRSPEIQERWFAMSRRRDPASLLGRAAAVVTGVTGLVVAWRWKSQRDAEVLAVLTEMGEQGLLGRLGGAGATGGEEGMHLQVMENALPVIEGMVYGVAPHRVLEAYRFVNGDAFLIGIADSVGDAYYGVLRGLIPAGEEHPDLEASLDALRSADAAADEGDKAALEACLNFSYALFRAPEDEDARRAVRRAVTLLIEAHGEEMERAAEGGADQVLRVVEKGWLFASPLVRGRERVAGL